MLETSEDAVEEMTDWLLQNDEPEHMVLDYMKKTCYSRHLFVEANPGRVDVICGRYPHLMDAGMVRTRGLDD